MIEFYNEDIDFPIINQTFLEDWINYIIENEGYKLGEISYIFCSDEYLLKINKEYLQHDYFTDIITFDYNSDKTVSGDLFISLDTIKSNSIDYKVPFEIELLRVIIHGILHLVGYDDKNDEDQLIMTQKEDQALNIYHTKFLI